MLMLFVAALLGAAFGAGVCGLCLLSRHTRELAALVEAQRQRMGAVRHDIALLSARFGTRA